MSQLSPRDQLKQFLSALWPQGFLGAWCLFWGAPSKHSEFVQEITDATLDRLEAWGKKENVYIGCGLRGQNLGPTRRGERDEVVAIPGLWLDIDHGAEHKKQNLPPTEAEGLALIDEMGPKPTMIVQSGRGLQAWWCFREPWLLDSEEERAKAEKLTKGWNTTLRAHAKAHGWDADQVGDLARVMRLPGTWNHKGVLKRTAILSQAENN